MYYSFTYHFHGEIQYSQKFADLQVICSLANVKELLLLDLTECQVLGLRGLGKVLRQTEKLEELSLQGVDWRMHDALTGLLQSCASQTLRFVKKFVIQFQRRLT